MDPGARTCDTTIELTRPRAGESFSEQHRQYLGPNGHRRHVMALAGRELILAVTGSIAAYKAALTSCASSGARRRASPS